MAIHEAHPHGIRDDIHVWCKSASIVVSCRPPRRGETSSEAMQGGSGSIPAGFGFRSGGSLSPNREHDAESAGFLAVGEASAGSGQGEGPNEPVRWPYDR
jgi:hypothetical protein